MDILNDLIPNQTDDIIFEYLKSNQCNLAEVLFASVFYNKYSVFKNLINQDVSPFEYTAINRNKNAVMYIIENDMEQYMDYIFENYNPKENEIDNFDTQKDFNPLLYAIFNNKNKYVKILIALGANVNILNKDNIFPLYDACKVNNIDIASLLIEQGANIYQCNIFNMSALGVALVKDSEKCIELLVNNISDFSKLLDYTIILLCSALKDDFKTYKTILSKLPKQEIIIQPTKVTSSNNLAGSRLIDLIENLVNDNKIPDKYLYSLVNFENGTSFEYVDSKPSELILKVAGVTYNNRQSTIKNLHLNDEIILKPEPDNQYDNNAVLVVTKHNEEIGYIPKSDNKPIFNNLINNIKYKAVVYSIPSSLFHDTLGVNIKIDFY